MLGIGIDVCRSARFREMLLKNPHRLQRLCARILHPEERHGLSSDNQVQRLASAWAAKEALYKSLDLSEQPSVRFNEWRKMWVNGKLQMVPDVAKPYECLLSLSHDGDYTVAMVLRQLKRGSSGS